MQAKLVALWMNHGFIHGVMNTDNTTISGETIDYGPCAFMNNYDPLTVYSYIDINGRYSYGNQPKIMLWNLSIFAEQFGSCYTKRKRTHQIILDCLKVYPILFEKYWIEGIKKLGFTLSFSEDKKIIELLLEIMFKQKSDFTLTFRRLSETLDLNKNHFISMFKNEKPILNWYNIWKKDLKKK